MQAARNPSVTTTLIQMLTSAISVSAVSSVEMPAAKIAAMKIADIPDGTSWTMK